MRKCWDFLDLTSRSFSAVIKELEGDLARTVRCTVTRVFIANVHSIWLDRFVYSTLYYAD